MSVSGLGGGSSQGLTSCQICGKASRRACGDGQTGKLAVPSRKTEFLQWWPAAANRRAARLLDHSPDEAPVRLSPNVTRRPPCWGCFRSILE